MAECRFIRDHQTFDWRPIRRLDDPAPFAITCDDDGNVKRFSLEYWESLPLRRPPSDIRFSDASLNP